MTFLEKQNNPEAPMHWRGDMQADYLYTNGTAGGKFFTALRDKGKFLACKCPECKKVYLPPRLYCEDCFCEIPDSAWREVPTTGTIRLFTVAMINTYGEKLKYPKIMAMIDIDKTDTSMIGVINTKDLDADYSGKKVKAVLLPKSKREGTLKDIKYFDLM
jgi:uncharacterized OB-fold protein